MRIEELTDIGYAVEDDNHAVITIDRPERMNSFRGRTVDELISAFKHAWADRRVAAIILTATGERAFCTGGDVKERAETGGYGETEWGTFEIERLHRIIRDVPKPVIAAVNGIAIGGGHVLHVLCDLTVAAEHATFGQAGPRVGSFDAGFGSAYLARVVGEKRARQMWFLLTRIDATRAERWGLVNEVVPAAELLDTARAWARTMGGYSPTALRFLKHSFNADSDHISGTRTSPSTAWSPTPRARRGWRARGRSPRSARRTSPASADPVVSPRRCGYPTVEPCDTGDA